MFVQWDYYVSRFEAWVEYQDLRWFYNETISPENLDMKVVSSSYVHESAGSTSQETIEISDPALGNKSAVYFWSGKYNVILFKL